MRNVFTFDRRIESVNSFNRGKLKKRNPETLLYNQYFIIIKCFWTFLARPAGKTNETSFFNYKIAKPSSPRVSANRGHRSRFRLARNARRAWTDRDAWYPHTRNERTNERGTPVITPADWWNQATSHFAVESVRINTGLLISPGSRPIRVHTAEKQPKRSRVEKARIGTGSFYVI